MAEDTSPTGGIIGFFVGLILAAACYFVVAILFQADPITALIPAAVAGAIGGTYSAIACAKKVSTVGFLSIVGFVLDVTWSLVNTLAGLLVWIPACKIFGANFVAPNDDSQRSGAFVYDSNPRGGAYGATTIGTVIAGGWSSHEEIHVWQARIFGPVYMLVYIISLLLNMLFRLITTKTQDLTMEAYYRIPFEEWAYWAGQGSGSAINWGLWILGFLLALVYSGALVSIPVGIAFGIWPLWLAALAVLIAYSVIRAFAPRGH
jgi:hypothetical protein